MSDTILSSIADAAKDMGSEMVKQVTGSGTAAVTTATQQVAGYKTEEEDQKKKAEQAATHARIQEINAEMAKIRAQQQEKKGPQMPSEEQQSMDGTTTEEEDTQIDEASRQVIGKVEQGRNFKG